MQERQTDTKPMAPVARPLSEIIIEMAKIGFKAPFHDQDPAPETSHILMLLATEAWNRDVLAVLPHPPTGQPSKLAEKMRAELRLSQADLEKHLISTDWETIIEMMQMYKQSHFSEDHRQIVACGYTPRGTLRVVWK